MQQKADIVDASCRFVCDVTILEFLAKCHINVNTSKQECIVSWLLILLKVSSEIKLLLLSVFYQKKFLIEFSILLHLSV